MKSLGKSHPNVAEIPNKNAQYKTQLGQHDNNTKCANELHKNARMNCIKMRVNMRVLKTHNIRSALKQQAQIGPRARVFIYIQSYLIAC